MKRHGFTFCICPDSMLLQEYIAELCSRNAEKQPWESCVYWGDEELEATFWDRLTIQNIFGSEVALIVRNAHAIPMEVWKKLSLTLRRQNPKVWPILCLECPWEKKQPKIPSGLQKLSCFTFAKEQGWIWSSPGIEPGSIKKYIQKQAEKLNLTFASGALDALAEKLPLQAASIQNELKKLALLRESNDLITIQDASIVNTTSVFDIFAVIRYIQTNNLSELWKILLIEQAKDEERLFYILAVMQKEAKKLWQLYANELTVSNAYDKVKKQLAVRLGPINIAKLWDVIHSAEFSVKSGQKTPEQSLEIFISKLPPIFC